jgi:hypothetical protein
MGVFIMKTKDAGDHAPHGPEKPTWSAGIYGANDQPFARYDCPCGYRMIVDLLGDGTCPKPNCCALAKPYDGSRDILYAKAKSPKNIQAMINEQLRANEKQAAEESRRRAQDEFADVPTWGV